MLYTYTDIFGSIHLMNKFIKQREKYGAYQFSSHVQFQGRKLWAKCILVILEKECVD